MICGTLPYAYVTSLNPDASVVTFVTHTEPGGQPRKKVKEKWREWISGLVEEDCPIGLCFPRLSSEKVYSAGS